MSLAGGIGWIGLASAHFSRRWVGARHAQLLPCAGLLGANIAVCADWAAAHIWYPQEVPVGAMVALLGVVVFLSLIRHKSTA
jgi:iron complex transport system permease protein